MTWISVVDRVERAVSRLKLQFKAVHYLYILTVIFVFTGLMYISTPSDFAIPYIDVLYLVTSASTVCGLTPLNFSTLTIFQQVLLMFCMFLGSPIFVSVGVVLVRRYWFEKRFQEVVRLSQLKQRQERNQRQRSEPAFRRLSRSMSRSRTLRDGSKGDDESKSRRENSTFGALRHSWIRRGSHEAQEPHIKFADRVAADHRDSTIGTDASDEPSVQVYRPPSSQDMDRSNDEQDESTVDVNNPEYPANDGNGSQSRHLHLSSEPEEDLNMDVRVQNENNAESNAEDDDQDPGLLRRPPQVIFFPENVEEERQAAREEFAREHDLENIPMERTNTVLSDLSWTSATSMHLSRQQRQEMGGIEYRALETLQMLLPIYFFGFQIFFAFMIRIWLAVTPSAQETLNSSQVTPINHWWFSFFTAVSSFNNAGMSPVDTSMVPFQKDIALLMMSAFLIIIGNTAFAILLRAIIWALYHLTPESREIHKQTLRFLLDHPRRCFTLLFPARQTFWLFLVLIALTLFEWFCIIVLDLNNATLTDLPWVYRVFASLFQSCSTRNAGFAAFNLSTLAPGVLVCYVVAMYISVYPVAISMRHTNIYEERTLGVYKEANLDDDGGLSAPSASLFSSNFNPIHRFSTRVTSSGDNQSNRSAGQRRWLAGPDFFVMTQIQRQLTSDIGWLILGFWLITITESSSIANDTTNFTVFSILYECVSAYANVGSSLGYSGVNYSLSGEFSTLGKLIIIALMYRGRHRGLPEAIDRAILLPSEKLHHKEMEDMELRRSNSIPRESSYARRSESLRYTPLTRVMATSAYSQREQDGDNERIP
ncbi:hypothetical protein BZG36_03065 [Bifiguratus adelaidae]|uniref:Potassium transport protein n=1 Tax=Bifiguratus adelaidae TaxID=1938954 RepID=A0A261XZH2_9FUNG|nr:hypothetical protein BZG36_03065 [Bifiguratus adelaidae]